MEIRDPIHGAIEISRPEMNLLDSKAYQRLRAIKQLGFSELAFPGATHNRYLHSLGVAHLAGRAFDVIFKKFQFSKPDASARLRQALRLGAFLHDIGHGPLSHASEEVMPQLQDLNVTAYRFRESSLGTQGPLQKNSLLPLDRQANHEDYTIKFITDSSLTKVFKEQFQNIDPLHVACLIDKTLKPQDDFFIVDGRDLRPLLSQIVSSEMDVDRMDYLERDAHFCGTVYGKVELEWLLSHLMYQEVDDRLHLALKRRALYTFDDFLLARHHMHLMVYFHHKSIIYEEMMHRYLSSNECSFKLPSDIEAYVRCTDYALYEHLSEQSNIWARRISERRPYRNLFELHSVAETARPLAMKEKLESEGVDVIYASSQARLSKYHSTTQLDRAFEIYVVDDFDRHSKPHPLEQSTEIFQKYEEIRRIDRLYVAPEEFARAERILVNHRL